jgi:hypothetical protein
VAVTWRVTVGVGLAVAFPVADGVAVGRWVGAAVAVRVGVAVRVAVAVDVALALDVGLSVAELLPVLPDDGEGVRLAPSEAVPVVTCGLGVKTDGVEEGDPLLQAATAIARTAAPAAARPTRSNIAGVTTGPVTAGMVTAGRVSVSGVPCARVGAGRVGAGRVGAGRVGAGVATGTVGRTFMKPPRMTGGQWRRSTHLSMCHPKRQRKSERANNSPPFPSAGIIPGADGRDVRIDGHI